MVEEFRQGWLLGFGHPLLDLTATVDESFLRKYNLEKNNAILGREEDESLCEDLRRKYEVSFTAGGSTQNAIRVAQWVMKEEKSTVFLGTIGDDDFGRLLKERILEDGVEEAYVVDKERSTGRCVVMLSDGGSNRSLVSFHGAARMFDPFHLYQRWSFVQRSKVIYSAGFTLAANYEAIIQLASHAATCHPLKIFSFNLSATYVSSNHSLPLLSLLPFIDILFGNDTEALALSHALRWEEEDLEKISEKLAGTSCKKKGRIVIITRGPGPVLVAVNDGKSVQVKRFQVPKVSEEEKVDTNGAGDAFVGGFLGTFVSRFPDDRIFIQNDLLEDCINTAIDCATKMIKVIGCDLNAFK